MDKLLEKINLHSSSISALVIIPILIGGIWQVASLSSISLFYLRFFSASQMIADGLIVIVITFFSWVLYAVTGIKISDLRDKIINGRPVSVMLVSTGFALIAASMVYIFTDSFTKITTNFWLFLPLIAVSISFFVVALLTVLAKSKYIEKLSKVTLLKYIFALFITYVIFGAVFLSIYLLTIFHTSFMSSDSFVNIGNLCQSNADRNTCRVRYFNDKYIFVEKKINDVMVIEILPFERFYKNGINGGGDK